MKRLVAGVILVAFNCTVILAQQRDKPSSTLTTPMPAGVLTSDTPPSVASLQLSPPHFTFGPSQAKNPIIRPSGQSTKQDDTIVFQDSALYMRVLGGQFLMPVPGGGASGCFTLDLQQRIANLREFIPKLDSLEQGRPQPH